MMFIVAWLLLNNNHFAQNNKLIKLKTADQGYLQTLSNIILGFSSLHLRKKSIEVNCI